MQADAVLMIVDPDNQIKEVVGFPIEYEETDKGADFHFSGELTIPVTWPNDPDNRPGWRAVLELPLGCFEWNLSFIPYQGDTISFDQTQDGAPLRTCTNRPQFATEEAVIAEVGVQDFPRV